MRRTYWLRILIVACVLVVIVAQRASAQESVRKEAEASGLTTQAPVPDDIYWDDRFTTRGVSGQVNAIAVSGSNVYVGGNFANADNIVVNRIAKWNGSNWSALGEGVGCGVSYCSPSVYAIAVNGSDVYVGGIFTSAGGIPASSIAVWNGSSWSALGAGVDGAVYAIAVSGNDVFVGGYFTTAGGVSAHSIAKWNALTHTWSGLGAGEGVFGGGYCYQCKSGMISVAAIAVSGSNVYVGGYFTSASGIDVNYIAKFDGVGWSALGSGVSFGSQTYYSPHVSAIAVSGNNVYVAGFFDTAGGVSANNVAVWDGNNWLPLGSGVSAGGYCGSNGVSSIVVSGTSVYVSGTFQAGGINNGIAVWDGINWNAVGGVISNESGCPTVNAIALGGTGLYAGGLFTRAGDTPVNNLARWMSSSWFAVGNSADNGIEGTISAIGVSGNDVYVGGCLSRIGSVSAHNIAKWNTVTNNWSALGLDASSCVNAIAVSGGNVYVGGYLFWAGASAFNGIAKWNGSAWSGLGAGVNGSVYAIAISGTNVYVGGSFSSAGSSPASNVAKWDGSAWTPLGTGTNSPVSAIAVSGSNVYVGGYFSTAGGIPAKNVARWNGSAWSALGSSGVGNPSPYWAEVRAIAVSGNDVYIGGAFTSARTPQERGSTTNDRAPRGVVASNIARWNALTNTWHSVGNGLDGSVSGIAVGMNKIYVDGNFTLAGSADANYIARWDGSNWSALGSGLNGYATAITTGGGSVYAAGNFTTAGAKASYHFARWYEFIPTTIIYFPIIAK